MEVTGLPSGTVCPSTPSRTRCPCRSKWESDAEAASEQRPARRYYEVTPAGKLPAHAAAERYPLLAHLAASDTHEPDRSAANQTPAASRQDRSRC